MKLAPRPAASADAEAVERRVSSLAAGAAERIAARDPGFWSEDPRARKSVSNRLGWLDAPREMLERVDELETFARDVAQAGIRDVVLLGMGGSSLAPEVLRRSLPRERGAPALHVLDSTDPATILDVTARIDPARTLFFVSSKSGTTIEANSLYAYFFDIAARATTTPGQQFIAVTDPGTPLETLAQTQGFRRVFTNAPDVGGRYSALTYFGLAPAAATGIDVRRLLEHGMLAADESQASDSPSMRLGAYLGEHALTGRDKATLLISRPVDAFGLWAEQLIAESTGKLGRGILPVDGEPHGSPKSYGADRAFVQLRMDGGYAAGDDALGSGIVSEGHPLFVIDRDDPHELGGEFFRWEYAVAVASHIIGVNPFDEPNVQESKSNTARVLRDFEQSGRLDPAIQPGGAATALMPDGSVTNNLTEALRALLGDLGPGSYFAITAYVRAAPGADAAFTDMRGAVRDAFRVATTLGYGPRFLHSTGQFHKGGPPTGVFLQVTADDPVDVPVPGEPFTFGQLKRAQSIGDFEALAAHGLPVLRVHLGTDVVAGLAELRRAVRAATLSTALSRR